MPEWNADAYDRLTKPHRAWAEQVLARLELRGDETVLDAGCGTGALTGLLLDRVPHGRVIGADSSPAMLAKAREALPSEVGLIDADLTQLGLENAVDAVFSSAVFHWIPDHRALFKSLAAALRAGGALEAQCGGEGNIAELERELEALAGDERFAPYLRGERRAWNYASVGDTIMRLEAAGFERVRVWLEEWPVTPDQSRGFLRGMILPWHLERLPQALHEEFLDAVLGSVPRPLTVEYVRLNISARLAGADAPGARS